MFCGYLAAVVTPFRDYNVDFPAFEKYIDFLINSGISGIVVCGTTGESTALSHDEKCLLIKKAAELTSGRVKLVAGVMEPITETCCNYVREFEKYVDGFLCICPYYLRPSQDQLYEHFKCISENTESEIIIYNIPHRTGVTLSFDTFKRLCKLKNISGIKDCTGNLAVFTTWRREIGESVSFLSGNDDTGCAALAMGASGVISVSANVVPKMCAEMYNSFREADLRRFCELRDALAPIHDLMFAEPSPGPAKYALSKLGLMKNELRRPLSVISGETQREIDAAMRKLQLI